MWYLTCRISFTLTSLIQGSHTATALFGVYLNCSTDHRWHVASHLMYTSDHAIFQPKTMAEGNIKFMSLPCRIFEHYVSASTIDGLQKCWSMAPIITCHGQLRQWPTGIVNASLKVRMHFCKILCKVSLCHRLSYWSCYSINSAYWLGKKLFRIGIKDDNLQTVWILQLIWRWTEQA